MTRFNPIIVLMATALISLLSMSPVDASFVPGGRTIAAEGSEDPGMVLYGDVDGDGYVDLIKRITSGVFYTFLSNGDGTFGNAIQTVATEGNDDPYWVLTGDVNGDGRYDLIKRSASGYFYTFLGQSNGSFSSAIRSPALEGSEDLGYVNIGDVDGDGYADLIKHTTSGIFYTFLSNGNGTFGNAIRTLAPEGSEDPYWVLTGDVNGDGRCDLIKRSASGYFYTFLGQSNGSFSSAIRSPASEGSEDVGYVNVGDINGDGRTDLIKHTASGTFYSFLANSNGTFGSAVQSSAIGGSEDPGWVLLGDINGDGRTDLIKRNSGGTFYTYQSMGNGTFGNEQQTTASEGWEDVGYVNVDDIDGDGSVDLIKHSGGGAFYTWLAN